MENKISAKTTKAELIEIVKQQEELLRKQESLVQDPLKEQVKANDERMTASAAAAISIEMFSNDIVQKYNDVMGTISLKEQELRDLYGIERNAQTLTALINSHRVKEDELKTNMKEKTDILNKDYQEMKALLDQEIAELRTEKEAVLDSIDSEAAEKRAALEKERKREEEEYTYDLKRRRKTDADAWNDEKAVREKEMAEKEADLAKREKFVADNEAYIAELEKKVAEIPAVKETAFNEGKKKGESDANKNNAFEVRALNSKNEYEQKALRDNIEHLNTALEASEMKVESLQNKLDAAYAQMREIATETVKSTGGVKIIGAGETGRMGTGK